MTIIREELLPVELSCCAHCGAERLVGIHWKDRLVQADGDCAFTHCFGKPSCQACFETGAYREGRVARPPGVLHAKLWEVDDCAACDGIGWRGEGRVRCPLCLGSKKIYSDGLSQEPGLCLPSAPIVDWTDFQVTGRNVNVALHPSKERALLLRSVYDFIIVQDQGLPTMLGEDLERGTVIYLWLEVEPGEPLYRVYEARFGRWLAEAEVRADYGGEWYERTRDSEPGFELVGTALELTLRVPREILQ